MKSPLWVKIFLWVVLLGAGFLILAYIAPNFFNEMLMSKKERAANNIIEVWHKMQKARDDAIPANTAAGEKFDLSKFTSELVEIDCSKCPPDFQAAWVKMIQSLEVFSSTNPDLMMASAMVEALKANTTTIREATKVLGDVRTSMLECKRIASQYGVSFNDQ